MQITLFRKLWRFITIALKIFMIYSVSGVLIYSVFPVPFTPLMCMRLIEQAISGKKIGIRHDWIAIEKMSPHIIQAAIAGEDNNFATHYGFDFEAIKKARIENKRGKRMRGASTITQQTCKNVFLWPGRTYLRKGLEAYYSVLVEAVWSKERIMEVYLNSIETGSGIFGIEAAARTYFKKPASKLTRHEAALIVASLPNPRKRNPARPSKYLIRYQQHILHLMNILGKIDIRKKR